MFIITREAGLLSWGGVLFFFFFTMSRFTHKQMMFARLMCSVLSTPCWFSPKCANLQRQNSKYEKADVLIIFVSIISFFHEENH